MSTSYYSIHIAEYDSGANPLKQFAFDFSYLKQAYIYVYVGVTELDIDNGDYSYDNDNQVRILTSLTDGDVITIKRITESDPLISFNDGSSMNEDNLDTAFTQSRHLMEEAVDAAISMEQVRRLIEGITYTWADVDAKDAQTGMVEDEIGIIDSSGDVYRYSGSAWIYWWTQATDTFIDGRVEEATQLDDETVLTENHLKLDDGRLYIEDDDTGERKVVGGNSNLEVDKETHGWTTADIGIPVYKGTGRGIYAQAHCSTEAAAEVIGVINKINSEDKFSVQAHGPMTLSETQMEALTGETDGIMTEKELFWLSESGAAYPYTKVPTTNNPFGKPMFQVIDVDLDNNECTIWLFEYRATSNASRTAPRRFFDNSSLTAGKYNFDHGLGIKQVILVVYDSNDKQVVPDDVTLTDDENLEIDLTSFGTITGVWSCVAISLGGTHLFTLSDETPEPIGEEDPGDSEASARANHVHGGSAVNLQDYEEDTFTPEFYAQTTDFDSVTYDIQTGTYVKVGNLVFITIRLRTDGYTGSPSGGIRIKGLPYLVVEHGGLCVSYSSEWGVNNPLSATVSASAYIIALYTRTTASGAISTVVDTDFGSGANDNYTIITGCYITNGTPNPG